MLSNLYDPCKNVDTVCVLVNPDFDLILTKDTMICSIDELKLLASGKGQGQNFSYEWSNKTNFGSQIHTGQEYSVNPSKREVYSVTVTSDSGCVKSKEVEISIPFPENVNLISSDTIICIEDTVGLSFDIGKYNPKLSQVAEYKCSSNLNDVVIGLAGNVTDENCNWGPTDCWPSPFSGIYSAAKQQFLYKASLLNSYGFGAGQIQEISFNIDSVSTIDTFFNYSIKIGVTKANSLHSKMISTVESVVLSKTIIPTLGWNKIILDFPFDWDGKSNLVVEICYDNLGKTHPINGTTNYITTNYNSSIYNSGSSGVCLATLTSNKAIKRVPQVKFGICDEFNKNEFKHNWYVFKTPIIGNSNDDSVSLFVDTNFVQVNARLIISDTVNQCLDTVKTYIHIYKKYDPRLKEKYHFCKNQEPFKLWNFIPGGIWSGEGIVDSTLGLFNPNLYVGSYTVYY